MHKIFLKEKDIKRGLLPYIIAEIGVNHECSMTKAKKMISLAASAGANAAKFQTYKADLLAVTNSPYYWNIESEKSKSQYNLFKKYDKFEKKNYVELSKYCKTKKIEFMSTPFDLSAVEFLNPIMNIYKIASADITNLPLIELIASKKKPVILSTGASSLNEIKTAIQILKKNGCKDISLMHCILNYPTKNIDANLNMIKDLKKNFPEYTVGYSDHTVPDKNMMILVSAFMKGARIIEKHFTLDKKKGNDHYHSMDYKDLKTFINNLRLINETGGYQRKFFLESEKIARKNARRSIVLNKTINKDEILTKDKLICKRPGTGISPLHWHKVIGKRVKYKISKDKLLSWKDFK